MFQKYPSPTDLFNVRPPSPWLLDPPPLHPSEFPCPSVGVVGRGVIGIVDNFWVHITAETVLPHCTTQRGGNANIKTSMNVFVTYTIPTQCMNHSNTKTNTNTRERRAPLIVHLSLHYVALVSLRDASTNTWRLNLRVINFKSPLQPHQKYYITQYCMKNLVFHSSLRWKIMYCILLTFSLLWLTHFSLKGWENVEYFLNLGSGRVTE